MQLRDAIFAHFALPLRKGCRMRNGHILDSAQPAASTLAERFLSSHPTLGTAFSLFFCPSLLSM